MKNQEVIEFVKNQYRKLLNLFDSVSVEMKRQEIQSLPISIILVNKKQLPEIKRISNLLETAYFQKRLVQQNVKESFYVSEEHKIAEAGKKNFIIQSIELRPFGEKKEDAYVWDIKNTLYEYVGGEYPLYLMYTYRLSYPAPADLFEDNVCAEMREMIFDLDYNFLVKQLAQRIEETLEKRNAI